MSGLFFKPFFLSFFVSRDKEYLDKKPGNHVLYLNGSFVLGQETDKFNGGFSAYQSFSGKISQLQWVFPAFKWILLILVFYSSLYSQALNDSDIEDLASCSNSSLEGDLINWNEDSWNVTEEVHVFQRPINWVCEAKNQSYVYNLSKITFIGLKLLFFRKKLRIIPMKKSHKAAQSLCRQISRSEIYAPTSKKENDHLKSSSVDLIPYCRSSFHSSGYFWLGLKKENKKWLFPNVS